MANLQFLNEKAFVTIPGTRGNKRLPFGKQPSQSKRLRSYSASVWEFGCSRYIANSLVAIPWGFTVDQEEVPPDHPAVELFKFVNEDDDWPDTLKGTVLDYVSSGFAIWLPQIVMGRIIRFKRVPVNRVTPQIEDDIIKGFFWNTHSTQVYLPFDQIVYFSDYGSQNPVKPDSPASVTVDKAQLDQGMDTNLISFQENYSVPPWVFTSSQNLKQAELDRYTDFWNQTWAKVKNRFKVAIMGGGLTPTRLRGVIKDMVFPELKKENRLEICAAYGVLPALVGAVTQVNRADRLEQVKFSYHTTIIPLANYLTGAINAAFEQYMFQNAEFTFWPERVELLQEERTSKSTRVIKELEIGILNLEAAVELLGYTPDQMGSLADANIYTDPQVSVFRDSVEKAEWNRFYKKVNRLAVEGKLDQLDFHSNIIRNIELEKAIADVFEGVE